MHTAIDRNCEYSVSTTERADLRTSRLFDSAEQKILIGTSSLILFMIVIV